MGQRFKVFYEGRYFKQWLIIDRHLKHVDKAPTLPGVFEKIAEILLMEHYL